MDLEPTQTNLTRPDVARTQWAWMALLTVLTLLFFGSFFNRFVGLRSGDGEFVTGMWFLRGHLPYRDYFSATPPLNTLKSALLLYLFGPFMIVSRIAAVAERVVIALILFRWLRRLFPERFAFTASLVAIIVSAGDMVDPVASYNHDAILWALVSGYAASRVLERRIDLQFFALSCTAGVFAGMCLITKQTVGVGAALAIPFVVAFLLLNKRAWRNALTWLAAFFAGVALPIALLGLWLHHLHVAETFLTMTLLKGPAAKGGHVGAFILREWKVAVDNWVFLSLAIVVNALTRRALYRSQEGIDGDPRTTSGNSAAWSKLTLAFGLTILTSEILSLAGMGAIHNLSKAAVYFVFIVTGVIVALNASAALTRPLTERQRQFALFAAVSFFVAFFLSLSWPAFEPMTLPGLALLVAAVLHGSGTRLRRCLYVVLGGLVFVQVDEKLDLPFGFEGLNEAPVRQAVQRSPLPELAGMRLPADMNSFLTQTVAIIDANATGADTILTYPETALFYELSGKGYPTLAASHNVDVVNDAFAAEESARILAARPAVVIYMKLTQEEVAREDQTWRFGKPSGQHQLVDAVEQLVAGYRIAGIFQVGQEGRPITVYVRP